MKKRKPNAYERECFYLGAKDFAFVHPELKAYDAAVQYLSGVAWLHSQSVDGIAAAVSQRLGGDPAEFGEKRTLRKL